MPFRISTSSSFMRFLVGLQSARFENAVAQERLSSGQRILRPSDDPTGTARVLGLERRLADVGRFGGAIDSGKDALDAAASGLEQASGLVSEARALLLQAMNGTLSDDDRSSLATEFRILREQLLEIGNLRVGEDYVFGGTRTDRAPWEVRGARVVYRGNGDERFQRIGDGIEVPINLPGSEVFAPGEPTGTSFTGTTGLARGTTADQGTGYERIVLRHDATDPGAIGGAGLALVDGGEHDTLLGTHELVIDATAGTVRLGDGPAKALPDAGAGDLTDFVVENGAGGTLHLDFSGFTGADFAGDVGGQGSISIDGEAFTAIDFDETDLTLENPDSGSIVHVDTTAVAAAGEELVTFTGTLNLFDLMQGIEEDLLNEVGLSGGALTSRLEARLSELDRGHETLVVSTSVLGARSQRLSVSGFRARDLAVRLEGLLSSERDADIAEVALELARTDATLQLAQAAGSRLIQTSLLNFLG